MALKKVYWSCQKPILTTFLLDGWHRRYAMSIGQTKREEDIGSIIQFV